MEGAARSDGPRRHTRTSLVAHVTRRRITTGDMSAAPDTPCASTGVGTSVAALASSTVSGHDGVAAPLQQLLRGVPEGGLVIDNQHSRGDGRDPDPAAAPCRGLPRPRALHEHPARRARPGVGHLRRAGRDSRPRRDRSLAPMGRAARSSTNCSHSRDRRARRGRARRPVTAARPRSRAVANGPRYGSRRGDRAWRRGQQGSTHRGVRERWPCPRLQGAH